jgi:hypothetical protein
MVILKALVAATKSWVDRAGVRVDTAALNMDSGTYDSKEFFRDAFHSVVTDPVQWYLDFTRLSDGSRVLLDTAL